jgi:hypothetical protein
MLKIPPVELAIHLFFGTAVLLELAFLAHRLGLIG